MRKLTLVEHLIVLAIIAVLAAIAVPKFKSGGRPGPEWGCRAWLKTLAGATEMFALDKNQARRAVDAALIAELKAGGYIQSSPYDDPRSLCRYRSAEKDVAEIACAEHGTFDEVLERARQKRAWQDREPARGLGGVATMAYALYLLACVFLPGAKQVVEVPRAESRIEFVAAPIRLTRTAAHGARCPVCADGLDASPVVCASCETPHHAECFRWNGACGRYACLAVVACLPGARKLTPVGGGTL